MSSQPVTVTHEPEKHRFVVQQDGETARIDLYAVGQRARSFGLIYRVSTALEGAAVSAARFAKTGLDYPRANNLEVVPLCSFVRGYIERKPEYQDLVRKPADSAASNSGGFA